MKKIMVLLLVLGFTQTIIAKDVSPVTKIIKIYTYGDGAVIKIANPSSNKSHCKYESAGEFLSVRFRDERSKILYTALLAAFVSGSKIRVASDGCDNIWGADKSLNEIYRVELRK